MSDVNEVGFLRTDNAILPTIVKKVFDERKHYKDLMKQAEKAGDAKLAALYDNRQGVKKIVINSMYGVCLAPGFHMYDIDCARAITRCARVTLRDWLKKYLDKYYVSEKMLTDVQTYFGKVEITVENKTIEFGYMDDITVLRNGNEIKIKAHEFNKETDLLGIDE